MISAESPPLADLLSETEPPKVSAIVFTTASPRDSFLENSENPALRSKYFLSLSISAEVPLSETVTQAF